MTDLDAELRQLVRDQFIRERRRVEAMDEAWRRRSLADNALGTQESAPDASSDR